MKKIKAAPKPAASKKVAAAQARKPVVPKAAPSSIKRPAAASSAACHSAKVSKPKTTVTVPAATVVVDVRNWQKGFIAGFGEGCRSGLLEGKPKGTDAGNGDPEALPGCPSTPPLATPSERGPPRCGPATTLLMPGALYVAHVPATHMDPKACGPPPATPMPGMPPNGAHGAAMPSTMIDAHYSHYKT